MSLVEATILSRLGKLKVHASLVNATITYDVSYVRDYSFLFVFSIGIFIFPKQSNKNVSILLEFHGTSLFE